MDLKTERFVEIGNKFYHFGENKTSWYKALLICRSLGSFLVSFDSAEEITALSNYLIANYPTDKWWISGSDLHAEGDFYWYRTGKPIIYADWSIGQPDNGGGRENCAHLWYKKPKYQMNDWICTQSAYYVCEADMPKTLAISVF
ncbi:LOW QUALITY PROTEIN: C-type lectin 37Da-like [Cochliomyia hominivorax]